MRFEKHGSQSNCRFVVQTNCSFQIISNGNFRSRSIIIPYLLIAFGDSQWNIQFLTWISSFCAIYLSFLPPRNALSHLICVPVKKRKKINIKDVQCIINRLRNVIALSIEFFLNSSKFAQRTSKKPLILTLHLRIVLNKYIRKLTLMFRPGSKLNCKSTEVRYLKIEGVLAIKISSMSVLKLKKEAKNTQQ